MGKGLQLNRSKCMSPQGMWSNVLNFSYQTWPIVLPTGAQVAVVVVECPSRDLTCQGSEEASQTESVITQAPITTPEPASGPKIYRTHPKHQTKYPKA